MRFSIWPINQQSLDDALEVVCHAEATGWDGAWFADHMMGGPNRPGEPVLEAWTTLTAMAVTVPRLRLGPLVLGATFRHPAVLAKMVATIAQLMPGRFVLGLGAGWQRNEHEALGIGLGSPAVRLRRLEEACRILRLLLEQGRGDVDGEFYRLDAAVAQPLPPEPVPLLLGVRGDRALRTRFRWSHH
jgi:alkanesulfonate monooxygenase SsuD/methylene tetrahydromethanopterin reductase-like flavin-dependent oxidoreductase (luciferase family)